MAIDLIDKIKGTMPEMSKGHKKIAEYILEHSDKAAFLTATKLGERMGISESTVVRFAIRVGFNGYPEFQKALQSSIRAKLTSVQRIEVSNDRIGEGEVLYKVLTSDMENIKISLDGIQIDAFNRAVELICEAKEIYIIGVRSSSMLANFLQYYLDLILNNVHLIQPTSASEMFERVLRISKGDVMIGISFPRYSKRTVNAVEYAKRRGADIIAITDSESSPILSFADCPLYAKSDMASFVDSLVAPLSVINALIVAIGRKKKETLANTFRELEDIWEEYNVYEKPHG